MNNSNAVFRDEWHLRFESNLAALTKLDHQVRKVGYNAERLRNHLSLLNANITLLDELDQARVNEALEGVGMNEQSRMFDSLREMRNQLAAKVNELKGRTAN